MGEVRTECIDDIGWVILNRPAVSNAVCPETMQAVCEALDRFIAAPEVRGIGITGSGDHFLAGGDFRFLEDMASHGTALSAYNSVYTLFQGVARRLFRCPKPTLAAISGAAITVGCEISLMCDVRVADETAFFEETWLRMALVPPLGGTLLLPRIVGLTRAKEMVLEGRRIQAQEALSIGLVSEVCPKLDLRDRAQARLQRMTALPHTAFRLAKEALHRGLESSMEAEWQAIVLAQGILLGSDDFRRCVAARKALAATPRK